MCEAVRYPSSRTISLSAWRPSDRIRNARVVIYMHSNMEKQQTQMQGHECVLITGGCGAIGSQVLNVLKRRYPNTRFVNVDALTYAGRKENIEPPYSNYVFYQANICDQHRMMMIFKTERPTLLLHFAAETHVDSSFGNSLQFTNTNVVGTHTLLECARAYNGFTKIVHMSTDEVYGPVTGESAKESSSLFAPTNPYAATKAAAEMICQAYMKSFNLPIIITRCNNAISKVQHEEKLIPQTILRFKRGERVPVHGNGLAKRTFIHTTDIADAMDVITAKGQLHSVYNIGTTDEWTVLEVIEEIARQMGKSESIDALVSFVDDRPFQDIRYSVDTTALRALGWTEKMSFAEAVAECLGNTVQAALQ